MSPKGFSPEYAAASFADYFIFAFKEKPGANN